MDIYHIWCNLKPGVHDLDFTGKMQAFLGKMQEGGKIRGFRVTRQKLGFGIPGLGEFHIMIEVTGLAQLDEAFRTAAARTEPVEGLHHAVNALVTDFKAALYRDFPDDIRKTGQEKF